MKNSNATLGESLVSYSSEIQSLLKESQATAGEWNKACSEAMQVEESVRAEQMKAIEGEHTKTAELETKINGDLESARDTSSANAEARMLMVKNNAVKSSKILSAIQSHAASTGKEVQAALHAPKESTANILSSIEASLDSTKTSTESFYASTVDAVSKLAKDVPEKLEGMKVDTDIFFNAEFCVGKTWSEPSKFPEYPVDKEGFCATLLNDR